MDEVAMKHLDELETPPLQRPYNANKTNYSRSVLLMSHVSQTDRFRHGKLIQPIRRSTILAALCVDLVDISNRHAGRKIIILQLKEPSAEHCHTLTLRLVRCQGLCRTVRQ
jgi:hypothetical protein